jgi:hypothetical protein
MLFHAWLELIEWVEDGAPSEAELIRAGARIGHWTEAEVKTMISTFNSAVAAGELREALSRSRYADRYGQGTELAVWRERSFVLNAPGTLWSPALLSGRFDRLVFGRERSSGEAVFAEVLDFKTSGPSAPLEHADQMTAYRSAAARLLGLDEEKVATRVVFLGGA